jgi:hypothetical protein
MGIGMRIFNARISRKILRRAILLAGVAVLAGCTTDGNPVRDTAIAVGMGPKIEAAPEFVTRSRPARLDFIPFGTAPPARPTAARTIDEVKATEAELEALRASHEAVAQSARQGGEATPAPAPVPIKPKSKKTP